MKIFALSKTVFLIAGFIFLLSACDQKTENVKFGVNATTSEISPLFSPQSSPAVTLKFPNLQAEILDERDQKTSSPLGSFDFKNYTYPLPKGWQDVDGKDVILENGTRRGGEKTIGLAYVTTKYFDATGDGQDEAFVILKIMTAGSAIPQAVYVYLWKNDAPELIWNFRTGDRADGGLKKLQMENGELVVELYGQDRYIIGDAETLKITGDEEQICCPAFFTRTRYKWNGSTFRLAGKRETYSLADKNSPAQENLGDAIAEREKKRK